MRNNGHQRPVAECARPECNYEAVWTPVLLIPAPREKVDQSRGRLVIHNQDVCQQHKESLHVTDFLGVSGWEHLKFQIEYTGDRIAPREEDLELEWAPVLKGRVS